MLLAATRGDAGYDLLLFLHILTVVVGFGSTFVWPFLASKSRQLGKPDTGYYVSQMAMQGSSVLTSPFIYATGALGVALLVVGDWEMGDLWVSLAFLLYFAGLGVSIGLHTPNLKAMLKLQEELATMGPPPQSAGAAAAGPPPQVLELQERGKKAGMYGGILHLLFVLILLDMILKPGVLYLN